MRYLEYSTSKRQKVEWLPGAKEEGIGNYCLMSMKFQFGKMKNILEMDGSDGCITSECT